MFNLKKINKRLLKKLGVIFIVVFMLSFIFSGNYSLFLEYEVLANPAEEQAALEKELEELEKRILQYEKDITKTREEKETLKRQISIFRSKINQLDLQIRQSNLMMRDIDLQIDDTKFSIEQTSLEIMNAQQKLGALLRGIYEQDKRTPVEIFLEEDRLSNFFNDLMALEILKGKNKEMLDVTKDLKFRLEEQKTALGREYEDLENIARIATFQKIEAADNRREQERLHRMTEAEYQQYKKEKADVVKRAAEIRAKIIHLVGIPDAAQLSFGELLDIAKVVEGQTGIRPAFLLAIITQESRLGRNVGQCYLSKDGIKTGDGIFRRTGKRAIRTMNPRRDVPHFLNITRELGIDTFRTPVSCVMWQRGRPVGWGGAMGPAQFIPSTWAKRRHILEPFVQGTPNPWNVNHAFLASALYLRDLGGQTNERRAALRYFAGGNWANPRFAFYGDQVVARINCLQTFIDHGTITSACERMIFIPR